MPGARGLSERIYAAAPKAEEPAFADDCSWRCVDPQTYLPVSAHAVAVLILPHNNPMPN